MQVDKEFISFYAHLSYVCFSSVVLLHVPTCLFLVSTTGFKCHKKCDGTHNIYQQNNELLPSPVLWMFSGQIKKSSEYV